MCPRWSWSHATLNAALVETRLLSFCDDQKWGLTHNDAVLIETCSDKMQDPLLTSMLSAMLSSRANFIPLTISATSGSRATRIKPANRKRKPMNALSLTNDLTKTHVRIPTSPSCCHTKHNNTKQGEEDTISPEKATNQLLVPIHQLPWSRARY